MKDKSRGRASGSVAVFYYNTLTIPFAIVDVTQHWIIVQFSYNSNTYYIISAYFKPKYKLDILLNIQQYTINSLKIGVNDIILGGGRNCGRGTEELSGLESYDSY